MKKILFMILCLAGGITLSGQNYLLNGSFEYGLNTDWTYEVTSDSRAGFTLEQSPNVMDGTVELKIDVASVSTSNPNSVKASTRMIAGDEEIYLLRFWARGPEESKIYVEVEGSETPAVLYEMHAGKTLFYFPYKIDTQKQDKEIIVNFYFRDDKTKEKNSSRCEVISSNGAVYYLDGVSILDKNNKEGVDVEATYIWNHKLSTTHSTWVAGDNDISILLPDGRTMWFFNDSFYAGKSDPTKNRLENWGAFVRNMVMVQELDDTFTSEPYPIENQGGQQVYFKIPEDQLIRNGNGDVQNFFWVGDAIMEDGKIKVHLLECLTVDNGVKDQMHPYLALFSYPELEYLGLERQADHCAGYETFFVDDEDNKIYFYRAEDFSSLKVARADVGDLSGNKGSWEFWDGSGWSKTEQTRANHISRYFDVIKLGPGNYVQVIMHSYTTAVQVCFAQQPQGPWTPRKTVFEASADAKFSYYMPNFHRKLDNGKYAISYSANFNYCLFGCRNCDDWAFVDKYWYRPRHIQVDLLALSPYSPKKDCAGTENGEAYIDECGECVGGTTGKEACVTGIAKLYTECNYSGKVTGLNPGDYLAEDLASLGFSGKELSALELEDDYVIELFDENGFKGNSKIINSSTPCLDSGSFNNKTVSLIVRRKGLTDLSGIYAIQNKQSGLYMSIQNQSIENNALVVQSDYTGKDSQHFELNYIGNGYYNIINLNSSLAVSIVGFSTEARANAEQWNGLNYVKVTHPEHGSVSAQHEGTTPAEGIEYLIDDDASTKYHTSNASGWIQFRLNTPRVVTRYSLVSADNAPIKDPKNWTLSGSMDGTNWVKLDEIPDIRFDRREEKTFYFENETAYTYYRMDMECRSGNALHLAEWKLFVGEIPQEGTDNQKYVIQDAGDGYVKFYNKNSDMALEVLDGLNNAGANIWQTPDVGQSGILWKLNDPQPNSLGEINKYENGKHEIIIYPNPVKEMLHIDLPEEYQGSEFFIYKGNGVLVHSGKLSSMTIDAGSLQSGYYLMKIIVKDDVLIARFVKY